MKPLLLPAAVLAFATQAAQAHTGHGHDGLGLLAGLRHALGEPDHLLMLAFGFALASWAAPRLVRRLARLGRLADGRVQRRLEQR